jgi:hypothetical protein
MSSYSDEEMKLLYAVAKLADANSSGPLGKIAGFMGIKPHTA